MDAITMVLIVLLVIVLVVGAVLAVLARRRARLRERFGPEYERAVEAAPSLEEAEADLRSRLQEHERLDIRPLTDEEQTEYEERWLDVQAEFVDRPDAAITDADALVAQLMRDRGYPMADFEHQADLISVDHPQVVAHYRDAHGVFTRTGSDEDVSTEDLRQALVSYRALFAELLDRHQDDDDHVDEDHEHDAHREAVR
jgi:hypothetical protein